MYDGTEMSKITIPFKYKAYENGVPVEKIGFYTDELCHHIRICNGCYSLHERNSQYCTECVHERGTDAVEKRRKANLKRLKVTEEEFLALTYRQKAELLLAPEKEEVVEKKPKKAKAKKKTTRKSKKKVV